MAAVRCCEVGAVLIRGPRWPVAYSLLYLYSSSCAWEAMATAAVASSCSYGEHADVHADVHAWWEACMSLIALALLSEIHLWLRV